jgi:ribosome-binding protein aMBF1 (putative translation factor)
VYAVRSEMEVADVGRSWRGVRSEGSRRDAQRHDSDTQAGIVMIRSDAQKERTATQIAGFRQALAKSERAMAGKRAAAVRGGYECIIRQLEDDMREYEELMSGALTLPTVERLDQIAPFVAKIRIARGMSKMDLARRLRVSKQVIRLCR